MRLTASLLLGSLLAAGASVTANSAESHAPRAESEAPRLVSHHALYQLRLAEAEGTKAPAAADGMISYRFSSDCEIYAQNLRQAIDMKPQEGRRQVSESRISTYEDSHGQAFHFNTNESGARGDDVEGLAQRASNGALAIALRTPRPDKLDADSAVLFPTQHIAKLITAAEQGQKFLSARVFDGSADGRKIFDVSAVIGAQRDIPDTDRAANAPQLQGLRRWPVTLAYFPGDRHDNMPDYTLSYDLYENGVSTHLRLDYGDYALVGDLVRVEFPAPTRCKK